MTAQAKVVVWFFVGLFTVTALVVSGPLAWWAALLIAAVVVGSSAVAIIGVLIGALGYALHQERQRQAQRPEWLPPVESWPPVPPGEPEPDEEDEDEEVELFVNAMQSRNEGSN